MWFRENVRPRWNIGVRILPIVTGRRGWPLPVGAASGSRAVVDSSRLLTIVGPGGPERSASPCT
jgi:hypothetical protein